MKDSRSLEELKIENFKLRVAFLNFMGFLDIPSAALRYKSDEMYSEIIKQGRSLKEELFPEDV